MVMMPWQRLQSKAKESKAKVKIFTTIITISSYPITTTFCSVTCRSAVNLNFKGFNLNLPRSDKLDEDSGGVARAKGQWK